MITLGGLVLTAAGVLTAIVLRAPEEVRPLRESRVA